MKKKINTEAIISELRGESVFFPAPTQPAIPQKSQELKPYPGNEDARTLTSENAATLSREDAITRGREIATARSSENARAKQRKLSKAQGLSLYEDQLKYLRHHKALMQLENKKIDIVEMIREAVDTYIAILKKKEETP